MKPLQYAYLFSLSLIGSLWIFGLSGNRDIWSFGKTVYLYLNHFSTKDLYKNFPKRQISLKGAEFIFRAILIYMLIKSGIKNRTPL